MVTVGLHFPLVAALHGAGGCSRLEIVFQLPRCILHPAPAPAAGGCPLSPRTAEGTSIPPTSLVLVALAKGPRVVMVVTGAELAFLP